MKWNYSCFIPGLPSLVAIGIVVMYIYIYNTFGLSHDLPKPHDQKGHKNLCRVPPQGKSHPFQVWWPKASLYWRYNDFSLSHDPARPLDQRMISQDHVIKEPYDFMGREPLGYHPVRSVGHSHSDDRNILFIVCYVSCCHSITSTCLINSIWVNSSKCTCLPNLVVIGLMEMEISILISILIWITREKLKLPSPSTIFRNFQNQEYQFTIPNSQIRLSVKEEVEEQRAL